MSAPLAPRPLAAPSALFLGYEEQIRTCAHLGPLADLACGRGRHALRAAQWGLSVIGLDRNPEFLAELSRRSETGGDALHCLRADLESAPCLPLAPASCGAVLVFRFLFRALAPRIEEILAPGGLLLYETFLRTQSGSSGGPRNPAFRLAPGELPSLFPGLETLEYEESEDEGWARLAARKPS
ncbi:MAG: class I SAM-dependent methyltransferase [Myxococcota bacterium]|nr:class I SAM-dependent methyltransferase [Myxococcota bacterium]